MIFLCKCALLLYLFISIAAAVAFTLLASGALDYELISGYLKEIIREPQALAVFIFIYLVNFIIIRIAFLALPIQGGIKYQTKEGQATVSLDAIKSVIKETVLRHKPARDVFCFFYHNKRRTRVIIKIGLVNSTNLPQLIAAIQLDVKSRLNEVFDFKDNVFIDVSISRMSYERDITPSDTNMRNGKKEAVL